MQRPAPLLSVVVPCLNEEGSLPLLMGRLSPVLNAITDSWEVVLVDDGSTDSTLDVMRALREDEPRVQFVSFSRNFGHEAATTAGVAHALGDAVVLIDADLQDPPELIGEMVERWREGADIVYATRESRDGENPFKLATSALFYRTLSRLADVEIPLDTGDFRLMSRPAVEAFLQMPERNRFVRAMVAWTGFPSAKVTYRRDARVAGDTKYGPVKLAILALDAITSFSTVPLQLTGWLGGCVTVLAAFGAVEMIIEKLFLGLEIEGYALQIVGMFFLGGIQLLMLGVIGAYVGRIYTEVQRRPHYFVRETTTPRDR